jgi:hypothetical protein
MEFNLKNLILVFVLAILLTSLGAQTGSQVQATGMGAITYNDLAAARDRAVQDALRKAVEQTLGTFIDSQTRVENYMVVEDRILNWTRGYVKNYQIQSERKAAEDMYEVTVNATVDVADLEKDANAVQNLIQNMGNPRIMFLVDEKNVGESFDRYHYFQVDMTAAETVLMNKFMEKNFQVIDPATVRANKERDAVLAAINGDNKAAAAIANAVDAEVVVTGKAVVTVASGVNLAGMKSCQANLTARVIDADVGTVLATAMKNSAYPHIDEVTGGMKAIEKAAGLLADELITKILEKWRTKMYQANTVKLLVMGLSNYTDASRFRGALQYVGRGIKAVNQRNMAGGVGEFDVQIAGTADQLARELDQRKVSDYTINVNGATANKITIQIVKQASAAQNPVPAASTTDTTRHN